MFACGVIKPHYTKTSLQLSDVNTKPLCGAAYHSKLAFLLVFDFTLHIHQNTTFLYFFLIAHYIRIILREVLLYPLLHLLFDFHLSGSFEALRFSNMGGGVLGLLRIPRYTPVPWIEDNAILALPVSVLTYAVLHTYH
jgi:hypothetical protein